MTDFEQILIPEKYRDKATPSKTETVVSEPVAEEAMQTPEDKWEKILADVKVGDIVTHKKFGDGTIAWIGTDKKYMRVKFPSGEKQFIFPDAFVLGFLELK